MKTPAPSNLPPRQRGVALVLVLCLIVLVTGLVVAYFSRALTTRQLSSASTSGTSAELLANSATDLILGDLKQEIAVGSNTPSPALPPAAGTVYFPTQAAYAVPQRNAAPTPGPATPPAPAVGPIPNLVRRSLRTDSTVGGANYVLSPPALSSRASAASSSTASANGRFVSTARWNRHYLIPTNHDPQKAPPPPSVYASTPVDDFTAPDWVFVTAEKGPVVLTSPAATVTGRYAYAIYDEGGLLDINHTGYPSASTLSHIGAKPAPSYADLTQLGMTQANVDNLLGWRNYATLQPTGAFPGLQPPPGTSTDSAYYTLISSNPGSLLRVPPTVWNNKTDQMFLSRQQLLGYFAAAGLDPKYLQYLGTFSRSLNQPSYLPEHSSTTLDPIRPPVLAPAAGGNDASGVTGITPNFLTARVVNSFTRYDGTQAIVGEPLVKKRFPLNRLAWLTYQGPSQTRNTSATDTTGPNADIGYLKKNGITKEWLDQGTPANVLLYFGLKWDPVTKWTYSHGINGSNGSILNVNNPTKTTDVARQTPAREPDFFELLKAAINPGSIAKPSLAPSILKAAQSSSHAAIDQYKLDTSLDIAVLQIGANIIDQFDTDGFPTQINYDFAGTGAAVSTLPAVYGDENLPYISRVRAGLLRLVEADPLETTVDAGTAPVKDTGVAAVMNYPEIWNPHDWSAAANPNALAQSVGAPAPGRFKIYAKTNENDGIRQATTVFVWNDVPPNGQPPGPNDAHHNSMDANVGNSPGFQDKYGFKFGTRGSQYGGEPRHLSENNTVMTFVINPTSAASEALFREPTILYKPDPTGSQLASPALVSTNNGGSNTDDGLGYITNNPSFFAASGGLLSAAGSSSNGNGIPAVKGTYIGFYVGAHPLRWWDDNSGTASNNFSVYQTQFGPVNDAIFTLACEDAPGSGNFITYDVKPLTTQGSPNAKLYQTVDSGFGLNGTTDLDYGLRFYQTLDPRSSRFGMVDPWIDSNVDSIPPRGIRSAPGLTQYPGVFYTDRDGVNSGTSLNLIFIGSDWFQSAMGWYHDPLNSQGVFRPGLLTQNDPNVTQDGKISTALTGPDYVSNGPFRPFYYADADGVVRRASAGNVDKGSAPASTLVGLPMAYAKGTLNNGQYSSGPSPRVVYPGVQQMDSRPSILNRPFRSVAELGYVYSGTPWKNLDFFLPESGDSALLDVFCVSDDSDSNALTAGRVNLNTHQVPVLQAILAQTGKDQWIDANAIPGNPAGSQAQQLAQLLVSRTVAGPTSGPNAGAGSQPLQNVSDLVGRWVKPVSVTTGFGGIDGKASSDGFATDLGVFFDAAATAELPMHNIQRFGESVVRTLSNGGQTRVWNLMFDLVAQTGRYPAQAATLDQFNVEGEQHYWVHVAIDRYTGQILDKQVEVVKE